jgi:hypothetical protein
MPAVSPVIQQAIQYVHLDSRLAADANRDDDFLLEAVRKRTHSLTAVMYCLRTEVRELEAIAVRSVVDAGVKGTGAVINRAVSRWLERLHGLAQGIPAGGTFFERFPEVSQYRLKRLAILPLRSGELMGLLTLGRADAAAFSPEEIDTSHRVAWLLTAMLERDALRRKLAERKLIERAKHVLRQRRRSSEEQAYLFLRNNSRQRRTPMVDLAREIIGTTIQSPITRRLAESSG